MAKLLKYTGVALDRANALRRDEAWVAERLADSGTLVAPVWRGHNLIKTGPKPKPVFLKGKAAQRAMEISTAGTVVLLGLEGGTAYAAADLSELDEDALAPFTKAGAKTGEFEDLRRVGALMAGPEGAILAYARGMIHWHQRHLFCGVCGAPTTNRDGGHVRICDTGDDTHMHFPRTDPAVIMLVTHDDPEGNGPACLLGRQRRWVEGMYSTLAGFVEPGESLEGAVAREVLEESNIHVTDVRYLASQPWPFPSSLMLGYQARAETTNIKIDGRELEDARWFTADEMKSFGEWGDAPPGEMRLPRTDSIARWLIDGWLGEVGGV